MHAARGAVDARRAAELAPGDDRDIIEHAPDVKIFDQRTEALVELGAVIADKSEVIAV